MEITQSLETFQEGARQLIDATASLDELEALRVRYLGKKGEVTAQLKQIGSLSHEERKTFPDDMN